MRHHPTILAQLLKWVPRHEFERLACQHHQGQSFRRTSRWSQFVALGMAHLSGRHSLRDIVANLMAQRSTWAQLGGRALPRSTFARLNARQPHGLYEGLFASLYGRCHAVAPRHRFRFKNKLYSLDASLIDLSLAIFPWADYNRGKAAMKLHVGLDHHGYLPAFAAITPSRTSDLAVARTLAFPRGSIIACDKGYTDYAWYEALTQQGLFFVTRQRDNACYRVLTRRPVPPGRGVLADQTIRLTGSKPRAIGAAPLRRVVYRDPEAGKRYVFLTNLFHLSAATIAALYKERWQIELFFKWIKQHLKLKAFVGTSKNAVLTQIWVALCIMLLLALLKLSSRIGWSLYQMLRLLQLNLFLKRDLPALLGTPPAHPPPEAQLALL